MSRWRNGAWLSVPLACCAVIFAAAPAANAAIATVARSVPITPANLGGLIPVSFPQFDPSLGTLQAVGVATTANLTIQFSVGNHRDHILDGTASYGLNARWASPHGYVVAGVDMDTPISTMTLHSGELYTSPSYTIGLSNGFTSGSQQALEPFLGEGSVVLTASATPNRKDNGPQGFNLSGNLYEGYFSASVLGSISGLLVYTYDPIILGTAAATGVGSLSITPPSPLSPFEVQPGDSASLGPGYRIETTIGPGEIDFQDGSKTMLVGPDTRFTIQSPPVPSLLDHIIHLDYGSFDMHDTSDNYQVTTRGAVVAVRGTDYTFGYEPGELFDALSLAVTSGIVDVTDIHGNSYSVSAGQSLNLLIAVPEPSTVMLALLGVFLWMGPVRHRWSIAVGST